MSIAHQDTATLLSSIQTCSTDSHSYSSPRKLIKTDRTFLQGAEGMLESIDEHLSSHIETSIEKQAAAKQQGGLVSSTNGSTLRAGEHLEGGIQKCTADQSLHQANRLISYSSQSTMEPETEDKSPPLPPKRPHCLLCSHSPRTTPSSRKESTSSLPLQSAICELKTTPQILSLPALDNVAPIKGTYYRNRGHFIEWLREETTRLGLSRYAYGCALFLMDQHYRTTPFNVQHFVPTGLAILVIASKVHETEVLYTPSVAANNQIETVKLRHLEQVLLVEFNFRLRRYNHAEVVFEMMGHWDEAVNKSKSSLLKFFDDQQISFLLFQKTFFFCDCHMKEHRQLLRSSIQAIFYEVLSQFDPSTQTVSTLLLEAFSQQCVSSKNQRKCSYELADSSDYQESERQKITMRESMEHWKTQFEDKKSELVQFYRERRLELKTYAMFLQIQF